LCDGFRLLWVTVPTVTKDLDLCMVIINVALSFTPAIYCRWPLGCSRASDEAVKAWSEAQRWQMRTLAGNLKTLTFYWLCVSLARVQGSLLILHRPSRSCLEEGLPGATGLCATGLLTLSLIDLMINWTLRHLTHQSRSAELPRYSEIQLERLGYAQSTTNQFVGGMLNSLIIMTPVPWAQIIVGDATFTQVLITSAEGVLFGIVFHVFYMHVLGAAGGRRCDFLQRHVLIPLLQWRCLRCRKREDSFPQVDTRWVRGLSTAEEDFASELEELRGQHSLRMRQETQEYEERRQKLQKRMPPELLHRQQFSGLADEARRSSSWQRWFLCLEALPGLEFLAIRNDQLFHRFATTEEDLKLAELSNQTLKQRINKASDEMVFQEAELHSQQEELTLQRQSSQEMHRQVTDQMQQAQTEHEQVLSQLRQTSKEAIASQQVQLSELQGMHHEQMQEAERQNAQKLEDEMQRQAQKLEEEKQTQKSLEKKFLEESERGRQEHEEALQRLRQQSEEAQARLRAEMLAKLTQHAEAMERAAQQVKRAHQQAAEETAKAQRNHEESLHRLRQESEQAQARQREEILRRQAAHSEAMRQATQDLERAQLESSLQLEAEKRKQGAFVQQLISFAQGLTKMIGAAKQGDRKALEIEHGNMQVLRDSMPEEAIRQLAGPLLDQARQKQQEWMRRLHDLSDALEKAKSYGGSDIDKLSQCARQLFAAVISAIKDGLRLSKHDEHLCVESEAWLFERWITSIARNHLDGAVGLDVATLHRRIIHKAMMAAKDDLGNFDFTDLEACLEAVDCTQQTFIDLARVQIEHNSPKSLARALSQLSALIYFLNYLEREDLQKTKDIFLASICSYGQLMGEEVKRWLTQACQAYDEDSALLCKADLQGIKDKKPADVIVQMSSRRCPGLGKFHQVFCRLARVWEQDFQVLSVPHHSQIVALLVFKAFLEDDQRKVRTLIAQVSTGEGKSLLIASLAVFVCLATGKRAHVVGSDNKLVLRDFENFRSLFREFASEVAPEMSPDRFAVACGDLQPGSGKPDIVQSIPDDAWIVYCEARHVTSFYTQKARQGKLGQTLYDDSVLILDEVDALVIDEDPTEDFVYDVSWRSLDRGNTVGDYATQLGRHFARCQACPDELKPVSDMEQHVYCQLVRLFREVEQWQLKPKKEKDAEFQLYAGNSEGNESSITGLYVRMQHGRAAPHYQSNFLECLRLKEHPDSSGYKMKWYQRLFVMSKPRVLQRYSKIIGLSGTIGDDWERDFLRKAYGAQFLIVPPFLQTCVDVKFHAAEWARTEQVLVNGQLQRCNMHMGLPGPGVVAATAEDQYALVELLCFNVRRRVPVLVITANPESAELVGDRLRQHARGALAGCNPSDLVRSLSQREYDRDPCMYKESLRAATRTLSRDSTGPREFRITVTDHTGARGTDYQMLDEVADKLGGLMLVVMHVPPSRRDWIQYKGRTARQNWRGQYCVVLNAEEYRELDQAGAQTALPRAAYSLRPGGAPYVPENPEDLVEHILNYGAEESKRRLESCEASYNAGFIANEVCERVWTQPGWFKAQAQSSGTAKVDVNLEGAGRAAFLDLCQRYRYLTAQELGQAAQAIEGPSEAPGWLDFVLERDSHVPNPEYRALPMPPHLAQRRKSVLFLIDVSGSMTSNKIGTELTRLDACKVQVRNILTNKDILRDGDQVGVVAFGAGHRRLLPKDGAAIVGPVDRTDVQALVDNRELEAAQVQTIKHYGPELQSLERSGRMTISTKKLGTYTFLYSTLCDCISELVQQRDELSRWLILLCDGDDTGGGKVEADCTQILHRHGNGVNVIIITVGSDVTRGSVLQGFADKVVERGSIGKYIAAANEENDSAIKDAFAQVEESLMLDGGGQTEASMTGR